MEMEQLLPMAKVLLSVMLCAIVGLVLHLYNGLILKPRKVRSLLQRQGIRGPSPSFLLGNISDMKKLQQLQELQSQSHEISHDWHCRVFPYIQKWKIEYGPIFMYTVGNIPHLCITDPEFVKEFSIYTSLDLGKPGYLTKDRGPLLGEGIITSNGAVWVHQRKIIAPQFYADKVKGMVNLMVESTVSMLTSWEAEIKSEGGVGNLRVDEDLRCLSADIISKASFGSSYSRGKEIFSKLKNLQTIMSQGSYGVPGQRYVPTKHNRDIWRLEREINSGILNVVKERQEVASELDLLQVILEAAKSCGDSDGIDPNKFIVDNCKNIYFAGHETTAITASWCLVLLAADQEWQSRVRNEVLEICKDGLSDADMLRSMKLLTMVIQETLRLYPPALFLVREALQDMKLGHIHIPKGTLLSIPMPAVHQNADIWGEDVNKFNPERFSRGIMGACKIPQAYLPFGFGPRVCAGQNFAMMELKAILSLIISKFQFSLSPTYRHSPAFQLVLQPQYGVHLHLRKV